MALPARLAKNSTYLTLSSIFQKIVSFWYFAYITGALEAKTLDNYVFALNYAGIFVIIMNFGLIPVLTREGAKQPEKIQEQMDTILTLKLIITAISSVVM
ncbi:MAG: oligosaccharide flippase family protein, partial [Patescibacteria group bacterium]